MPETPLLQVTAAHKTWPDGQRGLTLAELTLTAGTVTLVTGPNGAGKTTLLRILAGFEQPDVGCKFQWHGRAQRPHPGRDVCLLQQQPYLFATTTIANLAWVTKWHNHEPARAPALLDQAGLTALADRPVGELSGGEQRRLALARVIATAAPLLLLDEPTTSLDPPSCARAYELINAAAASGRTVLIALPTTAVPTQLNHATTLALIPASENQAHG